MGGCLYCVYLLLLAWSICCVELESETVMALRLKRMSTLQFRVPLVVGRSHLNLRPTEHAAN
jgi:hypothetical protein